MGCDAKLLMNAVKDVKVDGCCEVWKEKEGKHLWPARLFCMSCKLMGCAIG